MVNWSESVKRINDYYENQKGKITIGIDGFVDDVWQLKKDTGLPFEKISDYAHALLARGSGGMSFGSVQKRRSYGGFAANTGKAAGRLGGELTLIGMFGTDEYDPVFQEFSAYNSISLGEPHISLIYEFQDGKIMIGANRGGKPRPELSWDFLVSTMGAEGLKKAYEHADIVGFGYLGRVKYFEEMVTNLIDNFLAEGNCKRMFFDFANIQGRSKEEITGVLKTLSVLNKRMPMTLSLNEHEGKILFSFLNKDFNWETPQKGVEADMEHVHKETGLDELLIHTPFFAIGASATEGVQIVRQRNAEETVITTGAGDNFNGGYISACVQQGVLNLRERLFTANAVTGSYIRNGVSPDKEALKVEMEKLLNHMN